MDKLLTLDNLNLSATEIYLDLVPSVATNFSETVVDIYGPKRDSLHIVVPITIIYSIIFFMGLIGNISTCIVIARNKSMHTATNYYLFSLSVSDLLLLVSGLPQEMYSIWSRYPYVFGNIFCVLRGLFSETSANATVLTITAFTIERYVAICHPFLSHTMSKLSRAVKLILGIWVFAVCFAIPQALQFGVRPTVKDDPESLQCQVIKPIEHSFAVSTFLFFIAPMTLITVLYSLIGIRLRSSNMMKNKSSDTLRHPVSGRNILSAKRNSSCRHHGQSSRRVVKMLIAVVVAFFICWAPFHTQRLVAIYYTMPVDNKDHNKLLKIYEIVTYISGVLYYLSTSINPLLYNIMSNKFREAFKETFTRCCGLAHIKSGRTQRSYSVLSRSAQRGPDSTDSGKDDPSSTQNNHTSLTRKGSVDSFTGIQSGHRRCYVKRNFDKNTKSESEDSAVTVNSQCNRDRSEISLTLVAKYTSESISPNATFIAIHTKNVPQKKFNKFWQFFHCIAKRTLDDGKHFTSYYSSPVKEPNILVELEKTNKCDSLSDSPLESRHNNQRELESNVLEDELTTYMKEIRARERCS